MDTSKLLKIISKILVLIIVFFIGFYFGNQNNQLINLRNLEDQSQNISQTVDGLFDFNNGDIQTFSDINFKDKATLFDVLKELTMINDMEFSYTDYGGDLGVFIESINSVGNDTEGNKWWQYWVNDKHAEIGVSSYLVQPEDVVEFKFIESQF